MIPLWGIAKDSYLQAEDVIRAAARRIGELCERQRLLADAEDVFFLTDAEIEQGQFADARDLVARRRERVERYRQVDLPNTWVGDPVPLLPEDSGRTSGAGNASGPGLTSGSGDATLTGVGVSPGVVTILKRARMT